MVKLAATAENALKVNPVVLDLSSVGIGTSHSLVSKNQNTRALIAIDNIIQSPIVGTGITVSLAADLARGDTILTTSGITSIFTGDVIRVGSATTGEMMKVITTNHAGVTNKVRVHRNWMGTVLQDHSTHDIVEKLSLIHI